MRPGELMIMSRLPMEVASAARTARCSVGLDQIPLDSVWPLENNHQSFSVNHPSDHRDALMAALERVRIPSFELVFNRITSNGEGKRIHWTLRAKGHPPGFGFAVKAVRQAMLDEGIEDSTGHEPHTTLCYRAPYSFKGSLSIEPIIWRVDTIELVAAVASPYGYATIARRTLEPPIQHALL